MYVLPSGCVSVTLSTGTLFCSARLIKPSIVLFVVWTLFMINEICLDLICSWIAFKSCGAGSLPSSVAWANFLTWSLVLNPNASTAYSKTGSVVNTDFPFEKVPFYSYLYFFRRNLC